MKVLDRLKDRGSRGYAEASVLVVAGSLLAGVLFGTGLTRTAVDIGDGLTWFADDPTGEVIQVNPATGRPEARIDVGKAGDELGVAQYDGRLIVTNATTGELTSFDLASILVSGSRRVTPGGATDVLHHDGQVYLVDRERATVAAIDPVSTDTVGQIWQSPEGISDAVVDGQGKIWVVDPKGLLSELRWSDSAGEFLTDDERHVDHSGAGSVLVAHDEGVTLFGPDSGIVVQSHTGRDDEVVAGAPRLSGELISPESAPASIVPVSSPSTGTVVIVSDGAVHEVDVSAVGCSRPGRPEVFDATVFVPCPGDGKVIRLAADGQRAGEDIDIPDGGDPALVVDDGVLLINVPGADQGVVVDDAGAVSSIVRYDEDTPAVAGSGQLPLDPSSVGQIAAQDIQLPPPAPTQTPQAPQTPTQSPSQSPSQSPTAPSTIPVPTTGCFLPNPGCNQGGTGSGNSGGDDDGPSVVHPSTTHGPSGPSNGPSPTLPTAGTLAKPYGVIATPLDTGEVTISWSYPATAVDAFSIQEPGKSALARVDGKTRKVTVDLPPGKHRFTVSALRLGSTAATSTVTDELTSAGKPDAPPAVQGSVVGSDSSPVASVSITWGVPDDNGSPISGYTVVANDSFGEHRIDVDGTKASYDVQCADAYCDPGPVNVSVVARNAIGTSAAGGATLTYSGPTAPPLPSNGAQLVANQSHAWTGAPEEGIGTTTLALDPPADWASFAGTCTWIHSGNQGGDDSGTFPCGATSIDIPINNGPMQDGTGGVASHSIIFTAQSKAGTAESARFGWTTTQPTLCAGCPIQ